jgi:putative heme iron utilization protein
MEQAERALPVLRLLQSERNGVLSTLSSKLDGWPYGSLMPFALSEDGEPLVLLSTFAEHTQNVLNDPRVSLFVHDEAGTHENPQAAARATLICLAERWRAKKVRRLASVISNASHNRRGCFRWAISNSSNLKSNVCVISVDSVKCTG